VSTEFNHRQWRLAVLSSRELTDGQKVDILTRGEHCRFETGTNSWIAKPSIAELNGHTERQVYKSDAAGQKAGLLKVAEVRPGGTTVYSLSIPLSEGAGVPPSEGAGEDARECRGTPVLAGTQTLVAKTSTNSQPPTPSAGDGERVEGPEKDKSFEEIARDLHEYRSEFKPGILLPRLREVASQLNVSGVVLFQAICWWAGDWPEDYAAWDDVRNHGGYLHQILPNLVQDYLAARKRQAQELGIDPDGFDYAQWVCDNLPGEDTTQAADGENSAGRQAMDGRPRRSTSAKLNVWRCRTRPRRARRQ
jgi:hypothetical protein